MSRPIKVLLVEDNPADIDLTRETLLRGKLHLDISVAMDGEEALALLFPTTKGATPLRPDLILLDLNLPNLNGREVLEAIRADEGLRRVPIVILTSSDAEHDVVKSYELGANCYVTKPVGVQQFKTIVRSVEDFWLTVVKLP